MSRMFEQHRIRTTFSLDGPWEFYFPSEGTVIEPTAREDGECEVMNVP